MPIYFILLAAYVVVLLMTQGGKEVTSKPPGQFLMRRIGRGWILLFLRDMVGLLLRRR